MTRDEVITDILVREGWPVVTDRPSDRGGLTKGGVTFETYRHWREAKGLSTVTPHDFINLTEDEARAFYVDVFMRPLEFVSSDGSDDLTEGIFILLVDWAVMSGPDDPIRAIQKILARIGTYTGAIDGIAGPKTRQAWRNAIETDASLAESMRRSLAGTRIRAHVASAFDAEVRAFLASSQTTQLHNLRGWINRATEFI